MRVSFSNLPTTLEGDMDDPENIPTIAAKLEPWLQTTLSGFGGGIRRPEREKLVGWVNFVSCGVVSGKKLMFALENVTQLCHAYSKTFVGVIILPNRAGDLRASPIKHHANSFKFHFFSLKI